MSLWRRLRGLVGREIGGRQRKVPILGVEASGKSSLILTLGQYISLHRMGRVSMSSSSLFGDYLSYVAAGQPLPASTRWEEFGLHVTRVPEPGGGASDVDLYLSSEDIPGVDFRILVDELRKNPNLSAWKAGQSRAILDKFTQLLSSCDGFVFIIDLVRDRDPETFASGSREHVWTAFADQIKPIMTGILLATKTNAVMAMKPIFFVFSKPDLHRLPPDEVREHFERGMAIPLAQLRGELMNVRHYNVQCAGWEMDSALEGLGVDVLLSDLVHAVRAGSGEAR